MNVEFTREEFENFILLYIRDKLLGEDTSSEHLESFLTGVMGEKGKLATLSTAVSIDTYTKYNRFKRAMDDSIRIIA